MGVTQTRRCAASGARSSKRRRGALTELIVGADQVLGLLADQDVAGAGFAHPAFDSAPLAGDPGLAHAVTLATHRGFRQAVVEIADRHVQHLGELPDACRGDAVGAALVLLDLLEADADALGDLLLGQAEETAAAAQALAEMEIDVVAHGLTPRNATVPNGDDCASGGQKTGQAHP